MTKSMFSTYVSFLAALSTVAGLNLPFERRDGPLGAEVSSSLGPSRYNFSSVSASATQSGKVGNVNDMRYTTNVTFNGKAVTLALDTGSTDLWTNTPGGVGPFNDTKIPIEILYGDGSYGAKGTIGIAPVTFGAYTVQKQAFLNVVESTIQGLDDIGVFGIIGLSFDFAKASEINDAVMAAAGAGATWGHSFLHNIFDQHPDQPNFIALDLARSDDLEDTAGGSFYIGEYDPKYASVSKAPKLPQFPDGHNRWTVLLEGVNVDGSAIPVTSTVAGVPSGQLQAMLDSGDPTAMFPLAIWNAIYSKIPGAVKAPIGDNGKWVVPCNTTTIVELTFGGQKFPIHPLDLTTISDAITLPDGKEATACVSAIRGADGYADIGFEASLGDSFLRNVYSVFAFGDRPNGKPYIQLLNEITPEKAISQVSSIRGKTMASLPPELPPAELIKLLDLPPSNGGSTGHKGKTLASDKTGDEHATTITLDDDWKKYSLAAIGLLAANLLVGLVLLVFAILNCVKRGNSRKTPSSGAAQYVPVKLQEDYGYQKPYSQ